MFAFCQSAFIIKNSLLPGAEIFTGSFKVKKMYADSSLPLYNSHTTYLLATNIEFNNPVFTLFSYVKYDTYTNYLGILFLDNYMII